VLLLVVSCELFSSGNIVCSLVLLLAALLAISFLVLQGDILCILRARVRFYRCIGHFCNKSGTENYEWLNGF
jgi:hypothetical protein